MTEKPFDRFDELKRFAAEALNLPIDHPRTETLASIRMAHERQIEALAVGKHVDFSAFTKIIELLDKLTPPAHVKLDIQVIPSDKVIGPDGEMVDRPPRAAPLPDPPVDTCQPGTPAHEAARQAEPPKPAPCSRSPIDPHYVPDLQGDAISPLSVSYGGTSNSWGWAEPAEHWPNPNFDKRGKSRYQ
jgi:hypothetical protein